MNVLLLMLIHSNSFFCFEKKNEFGNIFYIQDVKGVEV
jgi:hypothetical protein